MKFFKAYKTRYQAAIPVPSGTNYQFIPTPVSCKICKQAVNLHVWLSDENGGSFLACPPRKR